ncbi:MAG: DUF6090 family protein [Marinifilaceae bacterium]
MRKFRLDLKIDWRSKLLDLLIVIIGITVAFKLNNWNESRKIINEEKAYASSFYNENRINQEKLVAVLDFSKSTKKDIDTLKTILLSKNYSDDRIQSLIGSMMAMTDFSPITTTMENITASGEFDVITDIELRKNIISTYNSFKTTTTHEILVSEYVNQYITPFFFQNIRFSDFSSLHTDFTKDPMLENIVFGYDILLSQLISGYKENLEKLNLLNEKLTSVNSLS